MSSRGNLPPWPNEEHFIPPPKPDMMEMFAYIQNQVYAHMPGDVDSCESGDGKAGMSYLSGSKEMVYRYRPDDEDVALFPWLRGVEEIWVSTQWKGWTN